MAPQRPGDPQRPGLGGRPQRGDHHRTRQRRGLVRQHDQALDAARPADAGRGRPAQLGDQPIVAAAAQHRALGADVRSDELEGGVGVVVQSAHQGRIDLEGDAGGRKPVFHRREEIPARLVEVIGERRGAGVDRLVALVLAVEDAQRIALQPVPRLLGKPRDVRRIVLDQHLAIDTAAFGIAERVELENAAIEDREPVENIGGDRYHLDIGTRFGRPQDLEVDLMELALAALLRPLVAEHRTGGEDLQRQLLGEFAVRHEGAADAGSVFRPERQRFIAAIGEGIHLLGDDIGGLADAAREQLGEFEDRGCHLAVAIQPRDIARGVDDMRETPEHIGKKIVRATDGLEFAHGKSPWKNIDGRKPEVAIRQRRGVDRPRQPWRLRSRPPSSRSVRPDDR